MARKNVKVDLHVNKIEALMTLLSVVNKKHIALGTDSPLNHINMADFDSKLKVAETKRASSKELRAQSEALMEAAYSIIGLGIDQGSTSPGTLYYYLTSIRDMLLVIYKGNEEQLSTWGFNVVSSSSSHGDNAPVSDPPPVEDM
ncbi:MAG: hypothetical protein K8S23_07325 [Candidatus Cloacimonetes bacterium]|nr:hypothetical protein [Candidatus Cloacimonadota bacterium]